MIGALSQICPARPLQLALAPLLPSLRQDLAEQSAKFSKRHELFRDTLSGSGWEVGASGAYFAIVKHPFKNVTNVEVSRRLASECGVVVSRRVLNSFGSKSNWVGITSDRVCSFGRSDVGQLDARVCCQCRRGIDTPSGYSNA
jgi:hypothetical protein